MELALLITLGCLIGATGARTLMLIFWKIGLPIPELPSYDFDTTVTPREEANMIGVCFGCITGGICAGICYGVGTTLISGLIGLALAPLIVPAIYLTLLVAFTALSFVFKLLVSGLGACSDALINLVPGKKNDDK